MLAQLRRSFLRASFIASGAACAVLAAPVSAQQPMELEIGASWQHPHSGIVVPDTLAGLPRGQATEYAPDFLNIGFSYRTDDPYEEVSLYIYRHTNGGLPVWFEQSRNAIAVRDAYAGAQLAFGVEQIGWPGAEGWQGLQAVYELPSSFQIKSTAVVLFVIDGWFVKMRASSASRSPEQLRELIGGAFADLTPPEPRVAQQPAIAVTDCEQKLEFKKKAKDAKQDGAAAIFGALLGSMAVEKLAEEKAEASGNEAQEPAPPAVWCRDGSLGPMQTAYRANASENSYLIALNDSGVGVSVGPDSAAQLLLDQKKKSKKQTYSISVITDSQRINFVPQNRLPSLERVLEVINANRRTSTVSTWGDDNSIEISEGAL